MSKEKIFIEEIKTIRNSIDKRIEMLHKHCEEYKEEGKYQLSKDCDLRARQFFTVLNSLDKALGIVG